MDTLEYLLPTAIDAHRASFRNSEQVTAATASPGITGRRHEVALRNDSLMLFA